MPFPRGWPPQWGGTWGPALGLLLLAVLLLEGPLEAEAAAVQGLMAFVVVGEVGQDQAPRAEKVGELGCQGGLGLRQRH